MYGRFENCLQIKGFSLKYNNLYNRLMWYRLVIQLRWSWCRGLIHYEILKLDLKQSYLISIWHF